MVYSPHEEDIRRLNTQPDQQYYEKGVKEKAYTNESEEGGAKKKVIGKSNSEVFGSNKVFKTFDMNERERSNIREIREKREMEKVEEENRGKNNRRSSRSSERESHEKVNKALLDSRGNKYVEGSIEERSQERSVERVSGKEGRKSEGNVYRKGSQEGSVSPNGKDKLISPRVEAVFEKLNEEREDFYEILHNLERRVAEIDEKSRQSTDGVGNVGKNVQINVDSSEGRVSDKFDSLKRHDSELKSEFNELVKRQRRYWNESGEEGESSGVETGRKKSPIKVKHVKSMNMKEVLRRKERGEVVGDDGKGEGVGIRVWNSAKGKGEKGMESGNDVVNDNGKSVNEEIRMGRDDVLLEETKKELASMYKELKEAQETLSRVVHDKEKEQAKLKNLTSGLISLHGLTFNRLKALYKTHVGLAKASMKVDATEMIKALMQELSQQQEGNKILFIALGDIIGQKIPVFKGKDDYMIKLEDYKIERYAEKGGNVGKGMIEELEGLKEQAVKAEEVVGVLEGENMRLVNELKEANEGLKRFKEENEVFQNRIGELSKSSAKIGEELELLEKEYSGMLEEKEKEVREMGRKLGEERARGEKVRELEDNVRRIVLEYGKYKEEVVRDKGEMERKLGEVKEENRVLLMEIKESGKMKEMLEEARREEVETKRVMGMVEKELDEVGRLRERLSEAEREKDGVLRDKEGVEKILIELKEENRRLLMEIKEREEYRVNESAKKKAKESYMEMLKGEVEELRKRAEGHRSNGRREMERDLELEGLRRILDEERGEEEGVGGWKDKDEDDGGKGRRVE